MMTNNELLLTSETAHGLQAIGHSMVLKNGDTHTVSQGDMEFLLSKYPGVDLNAELLKMSAWCWANPAKRKTKRGINAFINSWLNRAAANTSQPRFQRAAIVPTTRETTIEQDLTDKSWAL